MKLANRAGLIGVALFMLAAIVLIVQVDSRWLLLFSLVAQWIALILFLYAGVKGRRWWLVTPALLLVVYAWALTKGH